MPHTVRKIDLFFKYSRSDKEYNLDITCEGPEQYKVTAKFGPRGGTLTEVVKSRGLVSFPVAQTLFIKTRDEKLAKGYVEDGDDPFIDKITKAASIWRHTLSGTQWKALIQFIKEYAEEQA
jgi:hypothetical protein